MQHAASRRFVINLRIFRRAESSRADRVQYELIELRRLLVAIDHHRPGSQFELAHVAADLISTCNSAVDNDVKRRLSLAGDGRRQ